jgi:cytochrome P450
VASIPIVTPAGLGFLPADRAFIADPYPVYRRLRDEQPVLRNPGTRQWLISRHADADLLLRDRRLGRTILRQPTHAEFGQLEPPDWHDLARQPNPSLTFGAGIHYCLGAPLARIELGIAFGTVLRRVPHLEPVEAPGWKPTFVLRGLEGLRVRV